jgi:hypothetical protein
MDMKGYEEHFTEFLNECRAHDWPKVQSLFENGTVQPHTVTSGWDPLHVVARYGGGAVLKWLASRASFKLNLNAVSDASGKTPLHYAIGGWEVSSIAALLELKVDTEIKDNAGMLAIDCLCPTDSMEQEMRATMLSGELDMTKCRQVFLALKPLMPRANERLHRLCHTIDQYFLRPFVKKE